MSYRKVGDPVRQAAGDFLQGLEQWGAFGTLTFKEEVLPSYADEVLRRWCRQLAREYGTHVTVAHAFENRMHFHVLVALHGNRELLDTRFPDRAWRRSDRKAGYAKIEIFQPSLGTGHYLVKCEEWDVKVACHRPPACRRTSCVVAPASGAW